MEACRNRDMGVIDLLLKYSARDDDCKALAIGQTHDMFLQILATNFFTKFSVFCFSTRWTFSIEIKNADITLY